MTSYQDLENHTPMMRQWMQFKQQHPHSLLLFRMGDFYELFFEDAEKIAKLLDVTLTSRGETAGKKIPMAGVPHHAVEQYLARLVRLGVSCVIAEQFGEPGNGIMERKITRVITPGTVTESEWIGEKQDSLVAAVFRADMSSEWTVGWINLSTGLFRLIAGVRSLGDVLQRIQVNEVLCAKSVSHADLQDDPRVLRLDDAVFSSEYGAKLIRQVYDGIDVGSFGIGPQDADREGFICVIGALVRHLLDTQGRMPSHLAWPSKEDLTRYVVLDAATRKNLELSAPLQASSNGSPKTLWHTLDQCATTSGSRLLRRWIHQPERSQFEASSRHQAVEVLRSQPLHDMEWFAALAFCGDMERMVARVGLKTAKPKDLVGIRQAVAQFPHLVQGLSVLSGQSDRLAFLERSLEGSERVHALLVKHIQESRRTHIKDGDVIADGADKELDECRQLLANSDVFLQQLEAKERKSTGIATLRVEYNRNSGYTIEVSKGQADKVPVHYQRKQTLKNVERFTTAELRDFEAKALTAQDRALKRERVLYEQLLLELQDLVPWMVGAAYALSQLDVLWAFAQQANQWGYVRPVFDTKPGVDARGIRHPVVERVVGRDTFQANDCVFDDEHRTYIITGPNMGGKSTYMRQVALLAVMAYMGCPVAATECTLGPLDAVCTRIGASDDVAAGRSTFMVEMEEAANIVRDATPHTLAILDELGRGTSSMEGRALAQAILERLHLRNQALCLFATHYREVAFALENMAGVCTIQAQVKEEPGQVVFTHQMVAGVADKSFGIHVAMRAGLSDDVVARAQQLVNTQAPSSSEGPDMSFVQNLSLDDYSPKELWKLIESLQKRSA